MQPSITSAWNERVAANPSRVALRYFDGVLTAAELDAHSDALAVELQSRGVTHGDRIGIYLQNIPHYPISLLAIWKAGATAVPLNPMYLGAELRRLIDDSGTTGVILARGTEAATRDSLAGSTVTWLLSASARDFQSRNDPRVFAEDDSACAEGDRADDLADDLADVLAARAGQRPTPVALDPNDTAFITYTSGTTGPPKGALNTHTNYIESVRNYSEWLGMAPGDVSFAIAPLFHITGLSLNAGIALLNDATLSMAGRFDPELTIEAFREHGVTTTIGSITAFNAIMRLDSAGPEHFATIKLLYSGGAPIPPATIETFQRRFGPYLHNIWGMTETTGGGIAVPPGADAPVHQPSGTLSIGKAMQNVVVQTIDESGAVQAPGIEGELVFTAPQVIPGYWQNPDATAYALPGGHLHTGDVAVIDAEGWVYLVDRKKDLINAGGFKVWPREVEDVLYSHPAVFEAAVVGVADEYRGETVAAFVSLKPGAQATEADLIAFTRQHLAAYKYPRQITIISALPKTATGKIQRAVLRDQPAQQMQESLLPQQGQEKA